MKTSPPITVSDFHVMRREVHARAAGSQGRHRVIIRVAALGNGAWEGVVTALVADPALVAAILGGELPAALAEAAAPHALEPTAGELHGECGCRRSHGRCAHVRAVWRRVQEELRREPALVLTLRGRDALSLAADASALAAFSTRDQDLGVDAAAAYERTAGGLSALPDIQAPAAASSPDSWLEPDILSHQRLPEQAADAAGRALDILRGTGDGCLGLDRKTDVARIGAAFASPLDVSHLAWRAGMSPVELGKLIRAWKAGGTRDLAPVAPVPRPHVVTAVVSETGPALEQLSLF